MKIFKNKSSTYAIYMFKIFQRLGFVKKFPKNNQKNFSSCNNKQSEINEIYFYKNSVKHDEVTILH